MPGDLVSAHPQNGPSTSVVPRNRYAFTLPEVARRLNVSESSVRRWIKSGDLSATRVGPGGRFRISQAALATLERQP